MGDVIGQQKGCCKFDVFDKVGGVYLVGYAYLLHLDVVFFSKLLLVWWKMVSLRFDLFEEWEVMHGEDNN